MSHRISSESVSLIGRNVTPSSRSVFAALKRERSFSCAMMRTIATSTPRGEVMMQTLFPTGLDFLKLPYPEEWAESERRLTMIKTDELAAEIEALERVCRSMRP